MIIFSILFLLATITYTQATQEAVDIALVGRSWTLGYYDDWAGKLEGVRRELHNGPDAVQFYYFCDKATGEHKKNCGAWVDKKGNKIASAVLAVSRNEEGAVFSNLKVSDSAMYSRLPESTDEYQRLLQRVSLFVTEGPTTTTPSNPY
ncbi:unnamed protein product [Caenorhabditis brenneri]